MYNATLLRISLLASLTGFAASLVVHVAVLRGATFAGLVYGLHVGIFAVVLPVLLALVAVAKRLDIRKADRRAHRRFVWSILREIPVWQQVALGLAFVYATINLALALPDAVPGGAEESLFQRMASGHWIAFYVLNSVVASWLLSDAHARPDTETR